VRLARQAPDNASEASEARQGRLRSGAATWVVAVWAAAIAVVSRVRLE
jgi:hypothetical protein